MKLRLNLGSIVEITLVGSKATIKGKVAKVLDDEVQLIPQISFLGEEHYSADVPEEVVHINRKLISCWKYVKVYELEKIKLLKKDMEMYKLNYYNSKTGYCEGNGGYCGNIEEA